MYKSDWIAVGGWDTVKFKHNWGGEDIELYERVLSHGYDVHRCRLPGLFHNHHSKSGLWSDKSSSTLLNIRHVKLCSNH
jgi:GT2 family glycosyltransferase